MRFEFADDGKGQEILRDKITGEILARVIAFTSNGVTLSREDNLDKSETFSVTSTSQILGGTHIKSLLELLGKSSEDLIIPSDKSKK